MLVEISATKTTYSIFILSTRNHVATIAQKGGYTYIYLGNLQSVSDLESTDRSSRDKGKTETQFDEKYAHNFFAHVSKDYNFLFFIVGQIAIYKDYPESDYMHDRTAGTLQSTC